MATDLIQAHGDVGRQEAVTPGAKIVSLYVFLLFCRILEMLQLVGLGKLRLMLVVTVIALAVVFITGNLIKAIKTPLGILLIAWTSWMIICMPFSTWRLETLNQFLNNWLKSLMVFFIVAGLASTLFAYRRVMTAMGWAAAVACVLVLPGLSSAGTGNGANDRLVGVGTLSNPNEIAFHLWLGMSFLVLLAVRTGGVKRAILFGICCLQLLLILKTVSREGLLLGVVVFALALLRVSWANKIKLVSAAMLLCLAAMASLSRESIDRYLTLFSSKSDSSDAALSAAASSRMRQQKLMESIELTMRHPIFGVGMGVFMPASVEIAKENGGHVDWEVSHNSYTQVSSELGIPGLLLLLAMYATAFYRLLRLDRRAKYAGRDDLRQFAYALIVSLSVLAVHFCFDSMAYVFYMPLVMGLTAAFALSFETVEAEGRDRVEEAGTTLLAIAPAPRLQSARASNLSMQPRNPYRFGRRR